MGSKTILYDSIMVDAYHYMLVQTREIYNTKRTLIRLMQMYQCRFIICNKCTILVGLLIMEKPVLTWR